MTAAAQHEARARSDREAVDDHGQAAGSLRPGSTEQRAAAGSLVMDALAVRLGATVDRSDWPPFLEFEEELGMWLTVQDDGRCLTFNEMESWPVGVGVGSRVMRAIKQQLDETGRIGRFRDVTAPDFFDRFDWLTAEETGEQYEGRQIVDYWYRPSRPA